MGAFAVGLQNFQDDEARRQKDFEDYANRVLRERKREIDRDLDARQREIERMQIQAQQYMAHTLEPYQELFEQKANQNYLGIEQLRNEVNQLRQEVEEAKLLG